MNFSVEIMSTVNKGNADGSDSGTGSEHCQFFVVRKNRFCKMTLRKGEHFCGEHKGHDATSVADDNIRVPCPIDNSHSCYVRLLERHVKKCNAAKFTPPDYVMKSVNCGSNPHDKPTTKLTLSSVDNYTLTNLINKIVLTDVPDICMNVQYHPILEEELRKDIYGISTRKHLIQNSSLLGHLCNIDGLQPDTCFTEFGAGRGLLSYWIGEAMVQKCLPCLLVPIDRSSNRHKFDSKLRCQELVKILRLRVDIADLCLVRVAAVKERKSVVAVSKHLCGDATDLALRCLAYSNLNNIKSIIMAPCCHHRMNWVNYVGRDYMQSIGFSKDDFQLMSCLASWATCGPSSFNRGEVSKPEQRLAALDMSPQDFEEVGRKCKVIFDFGRARFLEKLGFKCNMMYYTDKNISPENLCLLATKKAEAFDIDTFN